MNNEREQIKNFILSEFVFDRKEIDADEDLLSNGILDSSGVLQLVFFMEKNYGISVGDEEIVPDNFQSINSLTQFIQRKKEAVS